MHLELDGVTKVLASPHLAGLRRLEVVTLFKDRKNIAAIAGAPQRDRLTHLYLCGNSLGKTDLRSLAAVDLPSLAVLDLGGNMGMEAQGATSLAGARFLAHLEELGLVNCRLGDAGLQSLVSSPHFRCPALLDVGTNKIGPAGLAALLAAPGLERLAVLDAGSNSLDDTAMAALASSPRLANLLVLDVGSNPRIGPAGAAALASSPHLSRLASLKMGGQIGEAGARALLDSPHLRRLQLAVNTDGVSQDTLQALSRRYHLPKW